MSGDDKSIFDTSNFLIKRTIAGIAIFFIPTIVTVVFNLIDNVANLDGLKECRVCLLDPTSGDCDDYVSEAEELRNSNN